MLGLLSYSLTFNKIKIYYHLYLQSERYSPARRPSHQISPFLIHACFFPFRKGNLKIMSVNIQSQQDPGGIVGSLVMVATTFLLIFRIYSTRARAGEFSSSNENFIQFHYSPVKSTANIFNVLKEARELINNCFLMINTN